LEHLVEHWWTAALSLVLLSYLGWCLQYLGERVFSGLFWCEEELFANYRMPWWLQNDVVW
jgi:hypothetical protein